MVSTVHADIFYSKMCNLQYECLTKLKIEVFKTWETVSFECPNLTFEVVSQTEMISKYILDNSSVIPTQFAYTKTISLIKIIENR